MSTYDILLRNNVFYLLLCPRIPRLARRLYSERVGCRNLLLSEREILVYPLKTEGK